VHAPVREPDVTARTTTLRGADAGRYYVEDQLGYYLDRGEPPGLWRGQGAARLGLDGNVDEEDFLDLLAGVDPRTGRALGTKHTDRTVRGFDVTCSAPKSASVLFAVGDDAVRQQVLESHDASVAVVVDWIERHAHCRYRINGKVCVFDAEGIGAAVFRQHTSRALDPQLHTHVVIVNRVLSPDGRWLALDGRTIKRDQQTLSRLYHAGLRAELTRRVGVRWREPVNGIAEITDVPDDVLAEFSHRTEAVDARIEEKLERFTETFERRPTPRERWKLEREAVIASRPPKAQADPVTLEQEWLARVADLGLAPERLVADAVGIERGIDRLDKPAAERLVERALATLAEKQSTWRVAELVRELAAAVPTTLTVRADQLAPWIDDVADTIVAARMVDLSRPVPDGVPLRRDGRPVTEAAVDRLLTLPDILVQEERLLALAERRLELGGVDHAVGPTGELSGPQRELALAVAGDRALVLAVGPAGTGKTTALRPAVDQLRREGRVVFGVAPSAAAAEVLATDTGVDADTLDKLLIEHALERPLDHRYDLPPGATVIVDEAAVVQTPRLAELVELADRRGWRLALIGDPLQFAAVGRSGTFGHFVDTFGAIELVQVHRFNHDWEREASLRLRCGDVSVVDLYERHDRLHGGTAGQMRRAVIGAWWDSTHHGETASMMAPTNSAVLALNREAQRRRLDAGEVDASGRSIEVGPNRIHAGDLVATRHNARQLVTDRHRMVKNRDRWTVETVHRDGSLSVAGRTGSVRLPTDYVSEHVELAYAETSHANQGRTVDRSFLYLDGTTGTSGIYVPMTRGRESNEAFVVIRGEETPADVVAEALSRTWIDRPAVAVRAELRGAGSMRDDDGRRSSPERPLDLTELRRLLERDAELDRTITVARVAHDTARHGAVSLARERASLSRSIEEYEARLAKARHTVAELDRPLVRRRHRVELDSARNQLDWVPRSIQEANEKVAQLDVQERQSAERLLEAAVVDDSRPQFLAERTIVRYQLDQDARLRGEQLAAAPPKQVLDHFGPRPAGEAGLLWVEGVGRVAQHRTAFDQHGTEILGRSPGLLHDNVYATSYRAARQVVERVDRALGRELEIEPQHRSLGRSL
jgi:conjugative relaxase-like TrwC/TraI family protein